MCEFRKTTVIPRPSLRKLGSLFAALALVLVLVSCSARSKKDRSCSTDGDCAPDKGLMCIGAQGLGFGVCDCTSGAVWNNLFGRCMDDEGSDEAQDEGTGTGFGGECVQRGECNKVKGLECVSGRCLCHLPSKTSTVWFWDQKYPDINKKYDSGCKPQKAGSYLGHKLVCDVSVDGRLEHFLSPKTWWYESRNRCYSLKERRTLALSQTVKFTSESFATLD